MKNIMPKNYKPKEVQVNFPVPVKLKKKIMVEAIDQGKTLKQVGSEALELFLNQNIFLEKLNTLWVLLDPITYKEFNQVYKAIDLNTLEELEKEEVRVGIVPAKNGVTLLAFLATITDFFCYKRLAACVDEKTGIIEGWQWYTMDGETDTRRMKNAEKNR